MCVCVCVAAADVGNALNYILLTDGCKNRDNDDDHGDVKVLCARVSLVSRSSLMDGGPRQLLGRT